MSAEPIHRGKNFEPNEGTGLSKRLEAAGWAFSLIWIGIAFLIDVGWGWGFLGLAAIVLGEAAIRWKLNLKIGGFWIVVGLMFLTGGLWELFHVPWPLAPVLIIGCGLAVLWGAVSGNHVAKK